MCCSVLAATAGTCARFRESSTCGPVLRRSWKKIIVSVMESRMVPEWQAINRIQFKKNTKKQKNEIKKKTEFSCRACNKF